MIGLVFLALLGAAGNAQLRYGHQSQRTNTANVTSTLFLWNRSCSPIGRQDCGWLWMFSTLSALAGVHQYRLPLLWRLPHQRPVDHLCSPLLAKVYLGSIIHCLRKVHWSKWPLILIPLCFAYFSPYSQIAILGDHHIWVHEGTEQYMSVDAIYWHQSYDYTTLDYDIMLMKLAHKVEMNNNVKPIALPRGCPNAGDMCTVSGWGNIYSDDGELLRNKYYFKLLWILCKAKEVNVFFFLSTLSTSACFKLVWPQHHVQTGTRDDVID